MSGEAGSKDGSNVTHTSSTPIDSSKAVQCPAVTNTVGDTSVPLQSTSLVPGSLYSAITAPT
jgi:hypothetical protein